MGGEGRELLAPCPNIADETTLRWDGFAKRVPSLRWRACSALARQAHDPSSLTSRDMRGARYESCIHAYPWCGRTNLFVLG